MKALLHSSDDMPSHPLIANEDGSALIPAKLAKETKSVVHRWTDRKSRLKLQASRFRIKIQTPETDVQHRRVGGRVWNGPIEILHRRVTLFCKKHVDRPSAIE